MTHEKVLEIIDDDFGRFGVVKTGDPLYDRETCEALFYIVLGYKKWVKFLDFMDNEGQYMTNAVELKEGLWNILTEEVD